MIHEEIQYLNLLQECIKNGTIRNPENERTGTGTIGQIGSMMKFDLTENKIPLFTTKKVFWKGIVEELLWFISGETDSYILENKGVNIWHGNTTREFLDKNGLNHVPDGDISTAYGFQWRNWGGDYNEWIKNKKRTGIDQLSELIEGLKNNPNSRRHVLSAWNLSQLKTMCLPPCHMISTWSILNNKLHCCLLCRSQDLFLGTPYNIASYGLFTHMIANELGIESGSLTWFGCDNHLYLNHIDQAKEQISRTPYSFPKIEITKGKSVFDVKYDDIKLIDYKSHSSIKAPMAI